MRTLRALLFTLAVSIAAASVALLGAHTNRRLDLTAGAEHRVNERTRARLDSLDHPVELVVAVAFDNLDPRARARVDDALDALDAASEALTVTRIDVGSPRGPALFEDLTRRLGARGAAERTAREAAARAILSEAGSLATEFPRLDAALASTAEADAANAPRLREFAAFVRVAAREFESLPPADDPAAAARAAADFAARAGPSFESIASELGGMTPGDTEARLRLAAAARQAESVRGMLASLAASSARLGETDLDRVARVLETGEAILLVGPPMPEGSGLVAIDLAEVYPPPEAYAIAGPEAEALTAGRAEQAILTALAVLTDRARPIVVFVHGEPRRWVGQAGVMTGLLERLARAGIDHAEWAPVAEPEPPDLASLDPAGLRPVVWCVISPNSAAGSDPNDPQSLPGTERARRVGGVVADLIARGESVLVNLNPSIFPTFGDEDPVAAALAPLGITARSGTPVLGAVSTPTGPGASPTQRVTPARSDHPVAAAIAGLPFAADWPVPLDAGPGGAPLVTLPASGETWAETQWVRLWRTPRGQRAMLLDQPGFDPDEGDTRGPWTIAVAARGPEVGARRSRAVVVGANTWMLDPAWRAPQAIGGTPLLANPGNIELFEAAVLWLAGRDELIAPSPTARPIPRIRPLSAGALGSLRWGLIGGLPLLVLAGGVVTRALRR